MSQDESDLEIIESEPSSSKSDEKSQPSTPNLSLQGAFKRHQVKINSDVLVEKKPLHPWIKAKVSSLPKDSIMTYRVKLIPKKFNNQMKDVFGKQLAVFQAAASKIPVATRVVAIYNEGVNSNYWSGIVAECPKSTNGHRYLIFYDDGSTQYVNHNDVFVVSESSTDVWDDVPDCNRLFIQNYLSKYPEIPMTKLCPDQELRTEWNCKWWDTKVIAVDASLVQLYFESDKRTEWIYRGSLRLEPLYRESIKNPAMFKPTFNKNKENISSSSSTKIDPMIKLPDDLNSSSMLLPNTSHGLVATKKVTQIRTLNNNKKKEGTVVGLPPIGTLIKNPAEIGSNVLVKIHPFMPWAQAKVIEIKSRYPLEYLIKYKSAKFSSQTKTVVAKDLAINQASMVIIPVNTRVVAIFEDTQSSKYYSGVIGEQPSIVNDWRYLVFFDDGYCQYVYHDKIRVVNESSPHVWQDVPVEIREFIKKYQESYPKRKMIKLSKNQYIQTEWDGKWYLAQVIDVDASLAQIKFNNDDRIEWIYRGSKRLNPIYKAEMENNEKNINNNNNNIDECKKQEPEKIEKTETKSNVPPAIKIEPKSFIKTSRPPKPKAIPISSVAKKSTTKN